MELMRLRAESHEDKYKKIDEEMGEVIDKKMSGQRRELVKKLWKEECVREEIRSRERWQNSNAKWTEKYEAEFLKFFEDENPFIYDEKFQPPNMRKTTQNQPEESEDTRELRNTNSRNVEEVIITGVNTYTEAANPASNRSTTPASTLIGKRVRFDKPNIKQPNPSYQKPPTSSQNNTYKRPPLLSVAGVELRNRQHRQFDCLIIY